MEKNSFIWETHGVHLGTFSDPVKHGVENVEDLINLAIKRGYPSITFVIHTPRLTNFRYDNEMNTGIKFIRGDSAYFEYYKTIQNVKNSYQNQINIISGVELEWQPGELGARWSRSKLFQAGEIDFVIGSVHFSKEKIPYDDSKEVTNKLIELRGGLDKFWEIYFEEMIEMVETIGDMIQVVGHLDLPKLYADIPECMNHLETDSHIINRKLIYLLELIKDKNLYLDVNMAGLDKKCGVYPNQEILRVAKKLNIPLTIGTDAHSISFLGKNYQASKEYLESSGFQSYNSFVNKIPQKRLFNHDPGIDLVNTASNFISRRFKKVNQELDITISGKYRSLSDYLPLANIIGNLDAVRVRSQGKSITISETPPKRDIKKIECLYSRHADRPGTLSLLFSVLASEGINIDTAFLSRQENQTGEALIKVSGPLDNLSTAVEFIKGTAPDRFFELEAMRTVELSPMSYSKYYIREIDGVIIPIKMAPKMIFSVHEDKPGVLFTLLAALASKEINVVDLRLGKRGGRGFSLISIEGSLDKAKSIFPEIGDHFYELSFIENNI